MESTAVLNVAESPVDFANTLERIRQRKEGLLRQQQDDEDEKIKYMAGQLDFSKFATGTAVDPVINDNVSGLFQKYAQRIKEKRGEGLASLLFDMSQDVSGLREYSNTAKQIRTNIEQRSKELGEDKDVDASKLNRQAMAYAFTKIDPQTGQLTIKNVDELDPNTDYAAYIFQNKPGDVLVGSSGVTNFFKELPRSDEGDLTVRKKNGITVKAKWTGKKTPFEDYTKDKDGNITGIEVVNIKEPEKIELNGQQVLVKNALPKELYDQYVNTNKIKYHIERDLQEMVKQKGIRGFSYNSQEADVLRRTIAYDYAKAYLPPTFKSEDIKEEKPIVIHTGGSRGGGSSASTDLIDPSEYVPVYNMITSEMQRRQGDPYVGINELPGKAQEVVLRIARNRLGSGVVNIGDLKIVNVNGKPTIRSARKIYASNGINAIEVLGANQLIATMDALSTDLTGNPTRKTTQEQIIKDNKRVYKGVDAQGNPIYE